MKKYISPLGHVLTIESALDLSGVWIVSLDENLIGEFQYSAHAQFFFNAFKEAFEYDEGEEAGGYSYTFKVAHATSEVTVVPDKKSNEYALLAEKARRLWMERHAGESVEFDGRKNCDQYNCLWEVGERRCQCGNRRITTTVDLFAENRPDSEGVKARQGIYALLIVTAY